MPALLETLLAVLACIGVALLPPWWGLLIWLVALAAFAASFRRERRGRGGEQKRLKARTACAPCPD
jgi:membrane protein implicated in regulation of membrane protease activity